MYKKMIALFIIASSICIESTAQVKHHVIIQLSSNDTAVWHGLMNNIKHLQDTWGKTVQVEVVAHGPGIELLVKAKTTQQERITELKNAGVVFDACMNTMKARNLSKDAIVADAGFVPSGVVEVVTKQEEGWSYLKGGF
jgi:intracellular sulfur oxidation DsrE/DsrF family protein